MANSKLEEEIKKAKKTTKRKKKSKRPKPINYTPRYPSKYTGSYPIVMRSSWEVNFAQYCDLNEDVIEWASEPCEIPYRNPVHGRQSVYIPDFLITIKKANGTVETRLIEIKPEKEALQEKAKNEYDRLSLMVNKAKWLAAAAWCQRRGIKFMTLTESSMFENKGPSVLTKPKKPKAIKKVGSVKNKTARKATSAKSLSTTGTKVKKTQRVKRA